MDNLTTQNNKKIISRIIWGFFFSCLIYTPLILPGGENYCPGLYESLDGLIGFKLWWCSYGFVLFGFVSFGFLFIGFGMMISGAIDYRKNRKNK